jgi:hypothetical protein
MSGDEIVEVVRGAYFTQWRSWEQLALQALAGTKGLASTPLVPGSDGIQLVTYDGQHLGHVRREGLELRGESWVAVPANQAGACGRYRSAEDATHGLARFCGKE